MIKILKLNNNSPMRVRCSAVGTSAVTGGTQAGSGTQAGRNKLHSTYWDTQTDFRWFRICVCRVHAATAEPGSAACGGNNSGNQKIRTR